MKGIYYMNENLMTIDSLPLPQAQPIRDIPSRKANKSNDLTRDESNGVK